MLQVRDIIVMFMLYMCGVIAWSQTVEEYEWIDPGDMIFYDHNTQSMKNKPKAEPSDVVETPVVQDNVMCAEMDIVIDKCHTENSQLKKEMSALNQTVIAMKKQISNCTALHEQTFFVQYVRVLLERFKNLAAMDDGVYQVDIKLTSEEYKYLEDYAINGLGSFQEVHSILLSMQQKSRWLTLVPDDDGAVWLNVQDYLTIVTQIVCTMGTVLLLLTYCPRSAWWICTRLVMTLFLVSVPWNWWHLYKKAVATKHAALSKTMPDACRPEHQSLWNVVVSLINIRTDECARYYENLEIDPMWEVPPLKAVSMTIIKFFLEPLEHIGEAVNKLVVSAYGGLPFYLWIPVSCILVILIFVIAGYRLRTLFFSLEPHQASPVQAAVRYELEAENRRLQELVDSREAQVAQLETENRGLLELAENNRLRREDIEARLQLAIESSERVTFAGAFGQGDGRLAIEEEKYPVVCTDIVELSELSNQAAAEPDIGRIITEEVSSNVDETSSDTGSGFDHLSEL